MQTQNGRAELKIGAVAYAPKVVTIWEGIREYLQGRGLLTIGASSEDNSHGFIKVPR